jgi:hypothetical protein
MPYQHINAIDTKKNHSKYVSIKKSKTWSMNAMKDILGIKGNNGVQG